MANSDSVPHTVTSDDGGPLDSGIIDGGESWSFTFTEPGTYSFYCEVHPNMKGSVTVVEESTTTTTHGGGHSTTTTAAPTPTTAPSEPPPSEPPPGGDDGEACPSAVTAALEPFWAHFQTAHLETSPGQQVNDAVNVDDYAAAHTALFEAMLDPLVGVLLAAPEGAEPFWAHFQTAHLETSPGQQVSDALNVDDYALAHTVLFDDMLSPAVDPLAGSC